MRAGGAALLDMIQIDGASGKPPALVGLEIGSTDGACASDMAVNGAGILDWDGFLWAAVPKRRRPRWKKRQIMQVWDSAFGQLSVPRTFTAALTLMY